MTRWRRRLPAGAELQSGGGVHFRVWSPEHDPISVLIERSEGRPCELPLERERDGYAAVFVPSARAGDRYRFKLNGKILADPASQYQPEGVFGPSQIVDPDAFAWSDAAWKGIGLRGQVLYELHVGTFTPEGTWRAAMAQLPELAALGVTAIEMMPIAEFPGRFGWGYDGVFPFAPTRLYGTPDDLCGFVDRAHACGLGVILDVVYNHFGPDGSVFAEYSKHYFSNTYDNEWGDALNFDGEHSNGLRDFVLANAAYWIEQYHFDGLRIDATQSIHDASDEHVLKALGVRAREAARGRGVVLIAENERQHTRLVRPIEEGGFGLDGLWNDDLHHTAIVAVTGRAEAYYSDHHGTPQELISAAKHGYLFQGQRYAWQKQPRGTRTDGLPPAAFVTFLENHDQVANSADGSRLHEKTTRGRFRAITAFMLLIPGTPMLFQGQEMAASAPFLYFADHKPELAAAVQKGRAEVLAQFPAIVDPEVQRRLAPPHDPQTFERSKLRWHERETHAWAYRLHRDLLALRRTDAAFAAQGQGLDGAVIGPEALVLRFAADERHDERLLLVNLGADVAAPSFAEPLVAPPEGMRWTLRWSSEHPSYGGRGTPAVVSADGWHLPGHAAVVLSPGELSTNGGDGITAR